MKQQPSKKAIELRLEWLNKALGRQLEPFTGQAPNCKATDAFYVDHGFGGYRLECQGHPTFGHQRLSKSELVDQMEAILATIKLARDEQSGAAWPAEQSRVVTVKEAVDCVRAMLPWLGKMIADGGHLSSVAPNAAIRAMEQADEILAKLNH